jgi:DNA-binding IclR family transcriptional regulator
VEVSNGKIEGSGRRLLLLLEVIAGLDAEFSLKELAQRAQLPVSTVHRLLQTLLEAGMVDRADSQSYRAGVKLLRLAGLLLKEFDAHKVAQPFLHELWAEWQETAVFALYKPRSRTATVVETIPAPRPLRFVMERFTEVSLPWGSFGRAILAHLPPHELDAVIAGRAPSSLTGQPPPSAEALMEQVARIRREGVAVFVDLEHEIAGLAAPVFGPQRTVIGSIGLAMPGSRFAAYDRARICAAVSNCGLRLSEAVGWTPIAGRPTV